MRVEDKVVGTGSINESVRRRAIKEKKAEKKRRKKLQRELTASGSLSPVHKIKELRQISSLPNDLTLAHDLQESLRVLLSSIAETE